MIIFIEFLSNLIIRLFIRNKIIVLAKNSIIKNQFIKFLNLNKAKSNLIFKNLFIHRLNEILLKMITISNDSNVNKENKKISRCG